MIDQNNQPDRDAELNQALELIHFGFRALTAQPDVRLRALGYSRVHHRVLYFVGRHPGCSVGELLDILGVSKQYLHRPIKKLDDDGYLELVTDTQDKRVKRLQLTEKGAELENELTGDQRARMARVFAKQGPHSEAGWRAVMRELIRSRQLDEFS